MTQAEMFALADRFMGAIERGDVDEIAACYAPDARIWHNHDGEEESREENLKVLRWVVKRLRNRKYHIVSRRAFADGYVQQHRLTGQLANGAAFEMPACVVVTVKDGRIARLEEYLDSAHLQPLLSAILP